MKGISHVAPVRADRSRHYWRMEPSRKAMEREVGKIWEMTSRQHGWQPLPELIGALNRHLKGWTNYYRLGQPRKAFQRLNRYVRQRLYQRLRRSSQRPWKPAPGQTAYGYFQELGLFTCESYVQQAHAKAGCGKSARPV
jgi:RNA-directed DNA polymerase